MIFIQEMLDWKNKKKKWPYRRFKKDSKKLWNLEEKWTKINVQENSVSLEG